MRVPKKAKKVFNGFIFDVYQWQQKMFDGSFETFEMLKRTDTVQIIGAEGNKLLLAEEIQPDNPKSFLALFGGRVESGESPLAAAKREFVEESGYTSTDWELWKKVEPYSKVEWTVYFYIARNCKKTSSQKLDAGEKIKIKKLSFDKFFSACTSDKFFGRDFTIELLQMKVKRKLGEFKKKINL